MVEKEKNSYTMSTTELKINLLNRIASLDDIHLIKQIQALLDFELGEEPYKLSDEQRHRIMEAKEEYLQGKTLSEKEANYAIEAWLKEK